MNEGHVGVGIFFVLSGFLIATRYADGLTLTTSWWRRYMQNRVARIYPLYFLLTCLTFGVAALQPASPFASYSPLDKVLILGLNITFLRGFFEQFVFSGIAQGWTLSVEETYYLSAPLVLLVLNRTRFRYTWLIFGVLTLAAVGAAIVRIAPHPYGFFSTYKFMCIFTLFGRVGEFATGMALAYALKRGSLPSRLSLTWLGLLWMAVCIVGMTFLRVEGVEGIENSSYGLLIVNNLFFPLGVAALLGGLIQEDTWLRRLLSTKAADVLGKSSYAFYLVHMGVIAGLVHNEQLIASIGNVLTTILTFVAMLLVAWLAWRFVEEPLREKLHAKSNKPR